MVPRSQTEGAGAERRFFLERAPDGGPIELVESDLRHALQTLRLRAGDRLIGLDGQGNAWPIAITAVTGRRMELALAGEPRRDPAPGEPGSFVPWIEVAVALPRAGAADEMLDRLVQLGVAAITPLVTERGARKVDASDGPRERWLRIARAACKQSGRAWLPEFHASATVADACARAAGARIALDPRSELGLSAWIEECASAPRAADRAGIERARSHFHRAHPLVVVVGPEGGFTATETATLRSHGAAFVCIGPHVLRIETAAEAAAAILVERFFTPRRS